MPEKFLSLDEFLTPKLIKPLYYAGLGLVLLWGMFALVNSLSLILVAPISALTGIIIAPIATCIGLLVVRVLAELYLAIFRLHDRFVGGHPKDGLPE